MGYAMPTPDGHWSRVSPGQPFTCTIERVGENRDKVSAVAWEHIIEVVKWPISGTAADSRRRATIRKEVN